MQRGEVWWVDLPDPTGSEPGFRRPVVIVQSNRFNRSRLETVIVAAVTGNTALASMPGNVLLRPGSAGLGRASVINLTQLIAVDRSRLMQRTGQLSPAKMHEVANGLRLVLEL